MTTNKIDRSRWKFGASVRVKKGVARKPWEWIGQIQLISGDVAAVMWRVMVPGSEGYPITQRSIHELELVEAVGVSWD